MPEFQVLLDGYRRFQNQEYQVQRDRWERLATGQEPPVMIIACCDSRVDPATIFDTEPGQAFVVRNVANIVPPFDPGGGVHGVSAAVEFAVQALGIRHIVVMGHGACGGIKAALDRRDETHRHESFLANWIALLSSARDRVASRQVEDPQLALELEGIRMSLGNLRGFPYVADKERQGALKLHGCHFAIAEGRLSLLDEAEDVFRPV